MSAAICPMCHRANTPRAKECDDCGYEFGQSIDTLRGMLKSQLRNQRATFWVLASTDLALAAVVAIGVVYGFVIFPLLPFTFVTYQLVGTGRRMSITKHSLQLTEQKQLPKATLVSG